MIIRSVAQTLALTTLVCLACGLGWAQQAELPSGPGLGERTSGLEQTAQGQSTQQPPNQQQEKSNPEQQTTPPKTNAEGEPVAVVKQQPKRILGIMPNYRAVSAGALPPPPTPKQAFIIATENSFDYSSFIFVGITSLLADATRAHPAIGQNGLTGYAGYYWRGLLDKTSGNYMVIFALPSVFHEDERYYARGEGNGTILKRGVYAATRILITPNYQGKNTFNTSEVLGRAISQGISTTYYPQADRTPGALAVKYGWAMGRDALTNVFREFWPDIAVHILHRHP
ncbi:MAG: hypothetical protein WAM79_16500 [Candidatus Sulfotelmatobacter sp.]